MRRYALTVGSVAAALGVVAVLFGLVKDQTALVSGGTSVIVAGLALIGVAAGFSTWREERAKAREQKQRETYGALVDLLYGKFRGVRFDPAVEGPLRAQVVVWGSGAAVKALADWNVTYDKHIGPMAPGSTVALSETAQKDLTRSLAALVSAIRSELELSSASEDEIRKALFNKSP